MEARLHHLSRPAALALAVCWLAFAASPAAAQEADLRVEAGFDGYHAPGRAVPVRIRVEARRLVRGTVTIDLDRHTVSRSVEVPGGSVKEFVVVAPTTYSGAGFVNVELRDARGEELASVSEALVVATDQELVGLLPGALGPRPLPGPAPLAVEAGVARFVAIDDALLATGPTGLWSVGTIAAAADEVGRLPAKLRSALLRWVAGGGRLLVDSPPGARVEGLPDEWQPGPDGRASADRGEIVAVDGAIAAGRWNGLVHPTELSPRGSMQGSTLQTLTDNLASEAGLRPPRLNALILAILVYVLAAGPVTYLVLRRRRRESLAWVAIPALALVFTGSSWAGARIVRTGYRSVHATVLSHTTAGTSASTYVGIVSQQGGEVRVRFPAGWMAARGWAGGSSPTTAGRAEAAGPEGVIPLNPGEFGMAWAHGSAEVGRGLVVTARAEGGKIVGTLRNDSPFRVEQAVVFVGKDAVKVGTLDPGTEQTWELAGTPSVTHFEVPGPAVWPGAVGSSSVVIGGPLVATPPAVANGSPVNYGLWNLPRAGPDFLAPGEALAVGWTKDYRPVIEVDGTSHRLAGRTMMTARAPVVWQDGVVPPLAVGREVVRGPGVVDQGPGSDEVTGDDPLVLKFRLPTAGPSGRVWTIRGPSSVARIEVWRDGAWRTVHDNPQPQQPQAGVGSVPLPRLQFQTVPQFRSFGGHFSSQHSGGSEVPMDDFALGTVETGEVYVRVTHGIDAHSGWAWTLRERT